MLLSKQVNVFDFAKLAKAKLDPLAWDYLDEGSDDEVSLRANRSRFDNLIIRPHFLQNDVSKIDTSITLFGKKLAQPFYLSVTGGKNCFVPNGELETARAAATANAMMITSGGISEVVSSGKGPKVWWQYTTAAEFRNKKQMAEFARQTGGRRLLRNLHHRGHLCRLPSRAQHAQWPGAQLVSIERRASKRERVSWSTIRTTSSGPRATFRAGGLFRHRPGTPSNNSAK